MSKTGSAKYRLWVCEDCGQCTKVYCAELWRQARIRCAGCGSIRMQPKTREAKKEREIGQLNVMEHWKERGSVRRDAYRESRGRKKST
jgi:ribosomal protein S27E